MGETSKDVTARLWPRKYRIYELSWRERYRIVSSLKNKNPRRNKRSDVVLAIYHHNEVGSKFIVDFSRRHTEQMFEYRVRVHIPSCFVLAYIQLVLECVNLAKWTPYFLLNSVLECLPILQS